MRNKQQMILFSMNLILFFTGTGLYPLLPLYADDFGVSQTVTGLFLASLSGMNGVGALLASRLLARFSAKQLMIAASALGVPALLILAQATVFWLVMSAAILLWFSGGFVTAILNVLTGLSADAESRGRAFSMLFLASSLAAVLGGTGVGALVSWLNYVSAFIVLAIIWGLIPVLGLFLSNVKVTNTAATPVARPASFGRSFRLLLISFLAIAAATQMGNLMALMGMQTARFSPAAISSTTVISGLVSMPVVLFAGLLSDRFGRQRLLLLSYLLVVFTAIPMAGAVDLWHFSLGITMLMLVMTLARPAVMALATDMLDPATLQRGLPMLEAGVMGIGVASSAVTGYLFETFGPAMVSSLTAALAVIGGGAFLLLITDNRQRPCHTPLQVIPFLKKAVGIRPTFGQAALSSCA